MSTFTLVGLTLAWGLGSILPEDRGGAALRSAMRPASILMFLALFTVIGFQVGVL